MINLENPTYPKEPNKIKGLFFSSIQRKTTARVGPRVSQKGQPLTPYAPSGIFDYLGLDNAAE